MINLDNIEEKDFITKPGKYTLTIKSVDFITTTNGNPCHSFSCVTEDGEWIKVSIYLTEKSMWKYKQFIKALGHPGTGLIDEVAISNACVGKSFIGTVEKSIRENLVTGEKEESKYFEVIKFEKLA